MRRGWLALALALAGCTPRGAKGDAGARGAGDGAPAAGDGSPPDSNPDGAREPGPAIDALPPSPSDDLTTRARHLLEAIAKDDPGLAADIVFPRDAYVAAKDAADPGKQWDDKVLAAFQRSVHALHKRTPNVERAQFSDFEVGVPISQVVPKKHDMKVALWRVRHGRLGFTIEGKESRFDVGEMMSWKGAWYVLSLR